MLYQRACASSFELTRTATRTFRRTMAGFELYSPSEVCAFLKQQIPTISEAVLDQVIAHKVDGEVFPYIDDEYLRELAPLVGDTFKVKKAIHKARELLSEVSFVTLTVSWQLYV